MSPVFDEEAEMRKEEIEELIRLVEESQINELEISEGRKKTRISKGISGISARIIQQGKLVQIVGVEESSV